MPKAAAAEAEPDFDVTVGPGFGLVRGVPELAEAGCSPSAVANRALQAIVERAERSLGVDAQLALVLATQPLSCKSLFYIPIANDARGIGYAHLGARDVFDDSPSSALEGIAFLNDWPYWQAHLDEFRSSFEHELGHRWSGRVHAALDGVSSLELLGRTQSHWSYFFDTGGSPLEGNVWVSDAGAEHTETPRHPSQYSPLDLYLMGAALPEEVPDFTLLRNATLPDSALDCRGQPLTPASPPQTCDSLAVQAQVATLQLGDVLDVEGARDPAPSTEPRSTSLLVLVLESSDTRFDATDCRDLSAALAVRRADFERATWGRRSLESVLDDAAGCTARAWSESPDSALLAPQTASSAADGSAMSCAFSSARPVPPPRFGSAALALSGVLAAAGLRRGIPRKR